MIEIECPTCRESKEIESLKDLPTFPFCCKRCKDGDLAKWVLGEYSIDDPDSGIMRDVPTDGDE
jgi:endogenous inhibitor of DNA gyrase (YacG/DUF329 family)